MNLVTVKPEYIDEFIELAKQASADAKERGVPFRHAWTVGNFGTMFQYAFITPIESFAALDTPRPLDAARRAKYRKYVSARESHASIYRADLSKPLPAGKTPTIAIITTSTIAPGRGGDYAEFVKNEILPYMSKPETGIEGFRRPANDLRGRHHLDDRGPR